MISSVKNRRVAEALKLRKRGLREQRQEFLVEGAQAVTEAIRSGPVLTQLFVGPDSAVHPATAQARQAGVPILEVSDDVVRALTSTVTPQGLVGVAPFIDVALDDLPPGVDLAAVLFAVRDPGNAGTVLRSADAAGAGVAVFSEASVDVYNPKIVRSSAGSLFHLPVVRDAPIARTIEALRRRDMSVIAASGGGSRDLYDVDLTRATAFVFGNEAWGLPEEVEALADEVVRIPIADRTESLNMATAASLFLFEAVRQRRGGRR